MYTTDHSSVRHGNRWTSALAGGLLVALTMLTAFSPIASAAPETLDAAPAMTTVVPEPATLIFFGAAATALFRRKWSRVLR